LSRIFESSSNLLICCWCWQRTITSASSICLDVLKGSAWSKRVSEDGGKRRKPNGLSCHIRVLLFIRTGAKIYSYPPPQWYYKKPILSDISLDVGMRSIVTEPFRVKHPTAARGGKADGIHDSVALMRAEI
jgi:hypothetical protein